MAFCLIKNPGKNMKKNLIILNTACIFSFLFVFQHVMANPSSASSDHKPSFFEQKTDKITFTDSSKAIVVKKTSPSFDIILQSNPTTGFTWSLKNYDSQIIKPVANKYFPPKNGLIGSAGYDKWTFMVKPGGFVVPQTTSITLIYARPWDQQSAQATNFKVVTVK